jgi:hypothetical protein
MPVTHTNPPILKDLADKHWGELGVYTGSAANQLGLAERKRRQDAFRPKATPIARRADQSFEIPDNDQSNLLSDGFKILWYIFLAMVAFGAFLDLCQWLTRSFF